MKKNSRNIKHYSFDVFDTCLTRICAYPKDIFLHLGRQLQEEGLWYGTPAEFKNLRVCAELETRTRQKPKEIHLREIYQTLSLSCNWDESDMQEAMRMEIMKEMDFLRPVPEIQASLHKHHQEGHKIIFISDMYLPEAIIQSALEKNDLWKHGDKLYVSNQLGIQKHRGLFNIVIAEEQISPESLLHTGDNFHADVRSASMAGIHARHFSDGMLNRHEILIRDRASLESEKDISSLVAASRLARHQFHKARNPKEKVFWDVGASVIGPAFGAFVQWCIEKAKELGLKRLYFIARDGQILCKIARLIDSTNEIDCRYLYGSRQAWHLPSITELTESDIDWISLHGTRQTLVGLLKRINITYKEIENQFDEGFSPHSADQFLTSHDLDRFRKWIQKPSIKRLIEEKALEARKAALGYLSEQGLSDGDPQWGIVDIGWGGNLQLSLTKLLKTNNTYPLEGIVGFYYSVICKKLSMPDRMYSFLNETTAENIDIMIRSYAAVIELLARADHGGTMGYKWNGNSYLPILNDEDSLNATLDGVKEQQQGAVAFIEQLLSLASPITLRNPCFTDMLLDFCRHPTKLEAETFGSIPLQSDQAGGQLGYIAPKVNLREALHYIFCTFGKGWTEATIARNENLSHFLLRARFLLRQLRSKNA